MNTKNNRYLTTVEANTYNRVETLIEIINELISILEYTKRNPKDGGRYLALFSAVSFGILAVLTLFSYLIMR